MKEYIVDVTASWIFYTAFLGASEFFIVGMAPLVVLKSRLFGMLVHAVFMRPYGKVRELWTKMWKLNYKSHLGLKLLSDTSISVLYQIPVYSTILFLAGATLNEWIIALPSGLIIGALTGRAYGFWLDKWRKIWKLKPTLDK